MHAEARCVEVNQLLQHHKVCEQLSQDWNMDLTPRPYFPLEQGTSGPDNSLLCVWPTYFSSIWIYTN